MSSGFNNDKGEASLELNGAVKMILLRSFHQEQTRALLSSR
jgi:hypothetical protein